MNSREERLILARERMMNRWPDRDEIEAKHMERFKGLTPEQLCENFEKASLERDRKVKEEQERKERMVLVTLLDIIKSNTLTKTIWKQELKCTEDFNGLLTLFDAYTRVVSEHQHSFEDGCGIYYKDLYDKVLNKFEEMS